jgi:uncharacterized protein (DUF885 family)
MRRLMLLLLPLTFLALTAAGREPVTEDERLADHFKGFLEDEFKSRPMEATRQGDHRQDHRLDDISAKARASWVERWRKTKEALSTEIDPTKLTRAAQIDREIFLHDLDYRLWLAETSKPFEEDPRTYNEYLVQSVYLIFTQSTLPKAENVKNAASRIDSIPRVVSAAKATLGTVPKVFAETAVRQNKGAIDFYKAGLFELSGENPKTSSLSGGARRAVAALEDYQEFLEKKLLPRAKGDWRLGKEKFAKKLLLELNAGVDAATVLSDAKAEFARVHNDLYVVARQLWAKTQPGKALPPDDKAGRRETITRVLAVLNNDHGKAGDLVKDARTYSDKIKAFITAKDILKLPEPDRCRVIEMPEFQRGFSVAYLEPAPPLDPKATSYYAISPPPTHWDARRKESMLQEYNRYMIQILTIHEAYPGHYVQLEYANRHPSLIRRVLSSGVFCEGWAVYTEQMMLDQGYGDGDPALRLNQLKWYLRAVANAILDHKMHCTDMTDEQAVAFLTNEAFQEEGEAVGKVIRAKLSSCQLSTYFVGRMAIYKLRQKVQRERGEAFRLGRFHEAVMSHGSVPVKYLPELVGKK